MKMFFRQLKSLVRLSFVELWRRNDIFALLILALALLVPLSMASPFGASGASRYLDEVALLLIWGFSSDTTPLKRNWARAMLIMIAVVFGIWLVWLAVSAAMRPYETLFY